MSIKLSNTFDILNVPPPILVNKSFNEVNLSDQGQTFDASAIDPSVSWHINGGRGDDTLIGGDKDDQLNGGDGLNNLQEFKANTDPTDGRSRLRVFAFNVESGKPVLSFESLLGEHYGIEYRDALGNGSWTTLNSNVWGHTDATTVTDPNATGQSSRFYRVRVQQ